MEGCEDGFLDIWSDEATIQLEILTLVCCSKERMGQVAALMCMFYNYSYCIDSNTPPMCMHELALASVAQKIVFFDGSMDAFLFVNILLTILLPFIVEKYPRGDRLMQGNDLQQL